MVGTLAWNARDVGSIPALDANISHCHHSHDTGCGDHDPVKAMRSVVVEPTLCMYM